MNSLPPDKFAALLARAKGLASVRKNAEAEAAISSLEVAVRSQRPDFVDTSMLGITEDSIKTSEGKESAVEILHDIHDISSITDNTTMVDSNTSTHQVTHTSLRTTGVAADVTLNEKQQLFVDTVLRGEDCVLIGPAGCGKTTATGKALKALQDTDYVGKVGDKTKWVQDHLPGILIVSYTRKAVNNIRRALPEELKPHAQTIHKFLEFQPVFYEIFDTKSNSLKKTMKFEPVRTATNPLPTGVKVIVYEESSMVGTDLYGLFSAALPHLPQEIFIGDIRQLPPVFGPAILGFKMSLLPIVELTEVYRQALKSPIIRLAHAILSGDSHRFSANTIEVEEMHPHLGKVVKRKRVPALEAFNEEGPDGTVKIQPWQKTLTETTALNTAVMQLKAWDKSGYYNPEDDVIICPFNKAFGTLELNKGIADYLARKNGWTVHEVIAGFEKHYLAVGDRVLYDKEDATIIDIKRNVAYLGKSFQPAHAHLDRWGAIQKDLSVSEELTLHSQQAEEDDDALDAFMSIDTEDEDRVNAASHAITIRFAYSDEVAVLSAVGEINNLLGGYALTTHKMQGSENRKVFFLLHKSHNVMLSNELLYTSITRAREFVHIICELDSFNKGVKTHRVRGRTLEDKIAFFKGKTEFKQMSKDEAFYQEQKRVKMELVKKRRKEIDDAAVRMDYEVGVDIQEQADRDYNEHLQGDYEHDIPDNEYIIDYTHLEPELLHTLDVDTSVYDQRPEELKSLEEKPKEQGNSPSNQTQSNPLLSRLRLLARNK